MALWGEPGAMIDGMYILTYVPLMTLHAIIIISIIHCTFSVYKQQCGYMNSILETCNSMS